MEILYCNRTFIWDMTYCIAIQSHLHSEIHFSADIFMNINTIFERDFRTVQSRTYYDNDERMTTMPRSFGCREMFHKGGWQCCLWLKPGLLRDMMWLAAVWSLQPTVMDALITARLFSQQNVSPTHREIDRTFLKPHVVRCWHGAGTKPPAADVLAAMTVAGSWHTRIPSRMGRSYWAWRPSPCCTWDKPALWMEEGWNWWWQETHKWQCHLCRGEITSPCHQCHLIEERMQVTECVHSVVKCSNVSFWRRCTQSVQSHIQRSMLGRWHVIVRHDDVARHLRYDMLYCNSESDLHSEIHFSADMFVNLILY